MIRVPAIIRVPDKICAPLFLGRNPIPAQNRFHQLAREALDSHAVAPGEHFIAERMGISPQQVEARTGHHIITDSVDDEYILTKPGTGENQKGYWELQNLNDEEDGTVGTLEDCAEIL